MLACSTTKSSYCTNVAAACTSAHNLAIMDTAIVAVSILLVRIICTLYT